jgi:arylsulfatase A-like enzyme
MYDTSVKVPFIVSCPGLIPQGVISSGLHSQYDFMPTVIDYLGFDNPEAENLPGRSFSASLEGKDDIGQEHVVVFDEYGPVRMIRTHEWKYVHRYPYGPHELYDLGRDPGERKNLADDENRGAILTEMRGRLADWFVRYVDPCRDGTRESVSGKGQIDLAGPKNKGRQAFVDA